MSISSLDNTTFIPALPSSSPKYLPIKKTTTSQEMAKTAPKKVSKQLDLVAKQPPKFSNRTEMEKKYPERPIDSRRYEFKVKVDYPIDVIKQYKQMMLAERRLFNPMAGVILNEPDTYFASKRY